jgi:hypothetical protein
MKQLSLQNVRRLFLGLLTIIGALWLISKVVFKPVQHVLLCDNGRSNCEVVQAEFGYDTMDGQFVIKKLYRQDATITFSPIDCWVNIDGSVCMNSTTNQNMTGVDSVIIPLAHELVSFRWAKK